MLEVGLTWPPETFLQWKLHGLAERGFRVTVASPANLVDPSFEFPGVELARLPAWGEPAVGQLAGIVWNAASLASRDPGRLRRLIAAARRPPVPPRQGGLAAQTRRLRGYVSLARLRPDVVHFEWESAAVHSLPLYGVWRAPVVVSCHGSGLQVYPYAGGAEHWVRGYGTVFERAAAVHVVSDVLRAAAEDFGADPGKTRVIRPAVDPERFRPSERRAPDAQGVFRVVSVGDLLWVKGHQYAIQAVRALLDAGVESRLDVLGGDPGPESGHASERKPLRFTIHDLGLDGRVRLHGAVPSQAVLDRLQQSDVLLHASVSEGIPTVVLEAMSCGLPVVVTDCGGIREAVEDGVEGFVVPKRDPAAMALALARLARDAALRSRMGDAGRQRVRAEYALDRQVDAFEELYRAAAKRPGT